ncbi:LysR family transcriptional regulator [Alteromonas gilva]|uniref:LysR family transcriptional regulator n=1 Tax=Alteromonas gilva TaxID=2987522 RepID=A0ABT5L911_9ALTE|nr:LysR family transcriptional regulator [Alteromonas gilva]MDC8832448.1 LysR family transcriptional regulator [Alteromonas gilva]
MGRKFTLKQLELLALLYRLGNQSEVAKSLHITVSAVSHQLRRIEKLCGFPLTYKQGRHLVLSEQARQFAEALTHHFADIDTLATQFLNQALTAINIGVDSALAMNRFTQALSFRDISGTVSDLRVRMLQCNDDPVALGLDMVLGQRIVDPRYHSELLQREEYIAVCSPAYLAKIGGEAEHWTTQATLLTLEDVNEWALWQIHVYPALTIKRQTYFSHTILLLQAVLNHQGVALLEKALVKEQLDNGLLCRVERKSLIVPERGYYLSVRRQIAGHASVKQEARWIKHWL